MCKRECIDCFGKFFRMRKCIDCGCPICRDCYKMSRGRCDVCNYMDEIPKCIECKQPITDQEKQSKGTCEVCGDIYCPICIQKNKDLYDIDVIQAQYSDYSSVKEEWCYICVNNNPRTTLANSSGEYR